MWDLTHRSETHSSHVSPLSENTTVVQRSQPQRSQGLRSVANRFHALSVDETSSVASGNHRYIQRTNRSHTQHLKTNSKATIQHWLTAMAWLGIPNHIKTDNGLNFVSKSVQTFVLKWGITLTHGILYNSTGQAIVEQVNQTLKSKLEVLAKTEGFANAIPPGDQARLLATALLALNQFPRGEEVNSPTQKHWATRALEDGPLVIIRNELGEWE